MRIRSFMAALAGAATFLGVGAAAAAEGSHAEYLHPHWDSDGIFGHFDQEQLQRGYQVYRMVCSNCHSMRLVAFRSLGQKGGPFYLEECPEELGLPESTNCSDPVQNPIVKSLSAEFQVEDGPDEFGDMFMREGRPADYFPMPFANRQQAMAANGGAYPPDMSLLVKARHHGANYIYSLLQGYPEEIPEQIDVPPGQYYNIYYEGDTTALLKPEYVDEEGHALEGVEVPTGGVFKMAQPLYDEMVEYTDGSPMTIEQYSKDVTAFLTWASEPKLEQRKAQGRFVILYLLIFAGIVYASYRSLWRNVH